MRVIQFLNMLLIFSNLDVSRLVMFTATKDEQLLNMRFMEVTLAVLRFVQSIDIADPQSLKKYARLSGAHSLQESSNLTM